MASGLGAGRDLGLVGVQEGHQLRELGPGDSLLTRVRIATMLAQGGAKACALRKLRARVGVGKCGASCFGGRVAPHLSHRTTARRACGRK